MYAAGNMMRKLDIRKEGSHPERSGKMFPKILNVRCVALEKISFRKNNLSFLSI